MILGWLYAAALIVAALVAMPRSPLWPMLCAWAAMAVLVVGYRPADAGKWITHVWAPAEAASLAISACCLILMLTRETRHPAPAQRFHLRFALLMLPISTVAIIWYFDRHDTWYWTFVAARSRFWQAMMLAWVILWANTWKGKRLSTDSHLCVLASIINGVAGSFGAWTAPNDRLAVQAVFRACLCLSLAWWTIRTVAGREARGSVSAIR